MSNREEKVHEMVKEYYSEITNKKGGELASSVCSCASHCIPDHIKSIAAELPDEIVARYYGCGSPIPDQIEGCTVLDLGCGTGRDVYVIAKLVGKNGRVIGIDMNDDQLAIAEKYKAEMAQKWGFSNVEFRKGYIEDLKSAGIEDKTIDVVISNCVINLSPDKHSVFSEIWRVLKDDGVLYFSDIFSDRHVPSEINTHPLLLGECLGGAMSHDEFDTLIKDIGWKDYTVVSSQEAPIHNKEIEDLVGDIQYTSDTVRAEKAIDAASGSGKKTKISIAQPHKKKSCCCGSSGCCSK